MLDLDKKEIEKYKCYLEENLSEKRYKHSLNVATEALKLAERYGADVDRCYLAGLLHDIAKELPVEKQLEYVKLSDLDVSEAEKSIKPVLHGISGAVLVDKLFNIKDSEIRNAIRYHTVARANMSLVEEIIYIADIISEDRDYKNIDEMRNYALISVDKVMYEALKYSVKKLANRNKIIPISTIEAYNQYVVRNK
ncbi:MAG: HD domain-containing protein [Clostridiales bacterium]|nr:HD domain-containing protein [Clostridiales bacterium]